MKDTKLVKSAGEFWVASVLSGLGWAAALTRDGVERTDILAARNDSPNMIQIQVKTASYSSKPNWRVNEKAQACDRSGHEWFVFVALADQPQGQPRAFIVPRDHVGAAAWIQHMDWLKDPDVAPGKRNAEVGQARLHAPILERYEDRWDLLSSATSAVPVLLPSSLRKLALKATIGLPPGHPWGTALPRW